MVSIRIQYVCAYILGINTSTEQYVCIFLTISRHFFLRHSDSTILKIYKISREIFFTTIFLQASDKNSILN